VIGHDAEMTAEFRAARGVFHDEGQPGGAEEDRRGQIQHDRRRWHDERFGDLQLLLDDPAGQQIDLTGDPHDHRVVVDGAADPHQFALVTGGVFGRTARLGHRDLPGSGC
jgi:hypothetical protein